MKPQSRTTDPAVFRQAVLDAGEVVSVVPTSGKGSLLERDGRRCVVPTVTFHYVVGAVDADHKPTGAILSYEDSLPLLSDGTLDDEGTMLGWLRGKHAWIIVFPRDIA